MKILSVDTASSLCGVCILDDDKIIKQIDLDSDRSHSERLMPIIKQIFDESNLSLSDIDLIVCDKGPGSFTGIRIGVATAMSFCDSYNINNIGISSLESLAYNVKNNGLICSLIDCKNGNCYFALYELKDESYSTVFEPNVDNIENIISVCQDTVLKTNQNIIFVGDGSKIHEELIKNKLPDSIISDEDKNVLNSYNLGLAGKNRFLKGAFSDINPMYLGKPQAEIQLEEKLKGTSSI